MRFDGMWYLCDDGAVRPVLLGETKTADGSWLKVPFLVDTAADRTVFSEAILQILGLPPVGGAGVLQGVGGNAATVTLATQIRLVREDGTPVLFTGQFAAFIDPGASDMSVLGREILNLFAVIVDRPQDVVCLLGGVHHYAILKG